MKYIYDIAVVFIFLAFLIYGYHKGLLRTLLQFAGSLVAIILAYLLVNPFTSWLAGQGFLLQTTDSIATNVGDQVQSLSGQMLFSLTNFMPEKWARTIIMQSESTQESLAVQAGAATARLFLAAIAFLILFVILRIILSGVIRAINRIIDYIPLVNWMNRFGGFILGGVSAAICVWLLTMLLTALAVHYESLHSVLSSSRILDFLSDKDIFMSLLDTII